MFPTARAAADQRIVRRAATVDESSSGESDDSEVIRYPFTKSFCVHRHASEIILKNLQEFQLLPGDARRAIPLQ